MRPKAQVGPSINISSEIQALWGELCLEQVQPAVRPTLPPSRQESRECSRTLNHEDWKAVEVSLLRPQTAPR